MATNLDSFGSVFFPFISPFQFSSYVFLQVRFCSKIYQKGLKTFQTVYKNFWHTTEYLCNSFKTLAYYYYFFAQFVFAICIDFCDSIFLIIRSFLCSIIIYLNFQIPHQCTSGEIFAIYVNYFYFGFNISLFCCVLIKYMIAFYFKVRFNKFPFNFSHYVGSIMNPISYQAYLYYFHFLFYGFCKHSSSHYIYNN